MGRVEPHSSSESLVRGGKLRCRSGKAAVEKFVRPP
jgi:hypothetical protein